MVIKIQEITIVTDLYCKPTNGHQYLHHDSCHADQIKRSFIFTQTLLKRTCSENNDVNVHVEDLKTWFCKRGYPGTILLRNGLKRPIDSVRVMKIIAKK